MSSDLAIAQALEDIKTLAIRIDSPQVVDCAQAIYKKNVSKLRGRMGNAAPAACLYIACRQQKVSRTFKCIRDMTNTVQKDFGKSYKFILQKLQINLSPINADDFVTRFCATLGLPKIVEDTAKHIARKAVELDVVPGRYPTSIAAAAIYMSCKAWTYYRTQKDIGKSTNTMYSLGKSYKLMKERADELLPSRFQRTTPT